jgi:DNA transformation protein
MAQAAPTGFVDHLVDLMAPWARVTPRAMFGGYGLYRDGLMFALIAYDELYLKADKQSQPQFERAGSAPFVYDGKGKPMTMSYWRAPEECLESSAAMRDWCALAWAAALRAAATKNKSVQKPAGKPKAKTTAKAATRTTTQAAAKADAVAAAQRRRKARTKS